MNIDSIFVRVRELLEKKNSFAICLPTNPTLDAVASATALYLALAKAGKEVSLVCEADLSTQFDLVAVDKIQASLSSKGDNLVVSFPYTEGAIDKVTYNIEGNQFNLLVQPKSGFERLDSSKVHFKYTGGKVDAIFVFDAPTLDALGDIYFSNEDSFKGIDIVNIDRHLTNANYGTINIVDKQAASLSQITFSLLKSLNSVLDPDIATNLFAGVVGATNNFTAYSVGADTFEVSAELLKAGAVKKPQLKARPSVSPIQNQFMDEEPFMPEVPQMPQNGFAQPLQQPQQPATTLNNREKAAVAPTTVEVKESTIEEQTPKEWLKPKIFKGSGLV